MTEEPYRWLEAIQNRREYIEDQLSPGLPVVALSAAPGILFLGVKSSTPKIFEIYDHLALGQPRPPRRHRESAPDRHRRRPHRGLRPAPRRTSVPGGSSATTSRPRSRPPSSRSSPRRFSFAASSGNSAPLPPTTPSGAWITTAPSPPRPAPISPTASSSAARVRSRKSGPSSHPRHRSSTIRSSPPPSPRCACSSGPSCAARKTRASSSPATPTDPAQLLEKLGAEALEFALLDRSLSGQPIAYRVPTADELGL